MLLENTAHSFSIKTIIAALFVVTMLYYLKKMEQKDAKCQESNKTTHWQRMCAKLKLNKAAKML